VHVAELPVLPLGHQPPTQPVVLGDRLGARPRHAGRPLGSGCLDVPNVNGAAVLVYVVLRSPGFAPMAGDGLDIGHAHLAVQVHVAGQDD